LTVGKQGRYVKYRIPQGEGPVDIAVLPTIMSAIMHSRGGKVQVKKRDYREKVRRKKTSSLISLVLDTSSSMVSYLKMKALQEVLDEMLLDAYQKRDRISIVACHGTDAEVVLPFTTSVEKGKKLLASLSFGGTTPLSKGIRLGLKNLMEKKAGEPAAVSLLVVLTDGGANTPETIGGDVNAELSRLAREIKDRGIPFLVVDVSPEGSDVARRLAEEGGGTYFHALSSSAGALKDPDLYSDVDMVLQQMANLTANPRIGGLLLEGFSREVLETVLDVLSSSVLEMDVVDGCPHGCDPHDLENLCATCRIRWEEGSLDVVKETMPVVMLPQDAEAGDLWGRRFVHWLVKGGLLSGANRGMVFIEDLESLDPEVAEELAEVLRTGRAPVPDMPEELRPPMHFTLVALGSRDSVPRALRDVFSITVDRGELDLIEERTRAIIFQKWFDTDPSQFENQLRRRWREMLVHAAEKRSEGKSVLLREREEVLCNRMEEAVPGIKNVCDIRELAKAYALLGDRTRVSQEDVERAVHTAVSLLSEEARNSIGPPSGDFADVAESSVVKEKLILPFINREELKLVLVDGFDSSTVSNATQFIKYLMLRMKTVEGCFFNCDPEEPAMFCRECSLKYGTGGGEVPVEEREVPIVQVAHETTLEELKGKLYISRVITYNIFSFAHRGVIFVENIDMMEDDAAEALADVLKRGENIVSNEEYTERHTARFTVIGTLSRRGAEINPLLLEQATMVIRASYEDFVDMHLAAYAFEYDYGNHPDGIIAAITEERKKAKERLERAAELLPETRLSDSAMDLITRICQVLGVSGNSTEAKIGAAARTLAAYEGVSVVEERHALEAARLVLPLSLMLETPEEVEGDTMAEEVADVA
ncbi:MAG: VWA domain-containing protein, partial [Thermoplasmata archaeon]|nr:VWA domain-containing protein [Thermoplasmata archaeon]